MTNVASDTSVPAATSARVVAEALRASAPSPARGAGRAAEHRRLGDRQPHVEPDEHQHGARQKRNAPAERRRTARRSAAESSRNTRAERRTRAARRAAGNIPYHARLPGGAFSTASSTAPPHSPPRPSPWPKRHSASSSGAATPIVCVGRQHPDRTVETPIVISAATSVVLRPTRSPKWPNSADPIGRARKAMRERGERRQRGRRRIGRRKEQPRKHEHRGRGVDVEVEELDRRADQTREQDLARRVDRGAGELNKTPPIRPAGGSFHEIRSLSTDHRVTRATEHVGSLCDSVPLWSVKSHSEEPI